LSNADRAKVEAARTTLRTVGRDEKVAELVAPYVPEAIQALVEVMRDPDSRQRRNAALDLIQLSLGAKPESSGKSDVRVVVLNASDVQRLGEMQRANVVQSK
jgi:hypothetical protein